MMMMMIVMIVIAMIVMLLFFVAAIDLTMTRTSLQALCLGDFANVTGVKNKMFHAFIVIYCGLSLIQIRPPVMVDGYSRIKVIITSNPRHRVGLRESKKPSVKI